MKRKNVSQILQMYMNRADQPRSADLSGPVEGLCKISNMQNLREFVYFWGLSNRSKSSFVLPDFVGLQFYNFKWVAKPKCNKGEDPEFQTLLKNLDFLPKVRRKLNDDDENLLTKGPMMTIFLRAAAGGGIVYSRSLIATDIVLSRLGLFKRISVTSLSQAIHVW